MKRPPAVPVATLRRLVKKWRAENIKSETYGDGADEESLTRLEAWIKAKSQCADELERKLPRKK